MVAGPSRANRRATEQEQETAAQDQAQGGGAHTPAHARALLDLQATAGNATVVRLLRSATGPAQAPDDVADRVRERLGRGEPLTADVQTTLGPALGAPLGGVRIHRDAEVGHPQHQIRPRKKRELGANLRHH